jgi:hypothetical protein
MPLIEAARAVLGLSIELKSTMSNALCDTEHIRGAKGLPQRYRGPDPRPRCPPIAWPRGPQTLKLACREAKALFARVDRCDPAQALTSLILNEDI